MITEFRVKNNTDVAKLASAIFSNMKNMKGIELSCLGAGSVNQAVKAFIDAKALATKNGIKLTIDPIYRDAVIDQDQIEKTLIIFTIGKEE